MLALQALQRDALQERVAGLQSRANHVVFGFVEARVVETHAPRQQPEDLDVARPRPAGQDGRASCR